MKPIVHYTEIFIAPTVGRSAVIKPKDHPGVSNKNPAQTSKVVFVGQNTFETENTMYVFEPPPYTNPNGTKFNHNEGIGF